MTFRWQYSWQGENMWIFHVWYIHKALGSWFDVHLDNLRPIFIKDLYQSCRGSMPTWLWNRFGNPVTVEDFEWVKILKKLVQILDEYDSEMLSSEPFPIIIKSMKQTPQSLHIITDPVAMTGSEGLSFSWIVPHSGISIRITWKCCWLCG